MIATIASGVIAAWLIGCAIATPIIMIYAAWEETR